MWRQLGRYAALVLTLGLTGTALAQGMAPVTLPMQGFLTDGAGAAVDGSTDLTITLYDGETSTTVLYAEVQTVMVEQGHFTAYVGTGTATEGVFGHELFRDNAVVWVGIAIDEGTELPRIELGAVPYASFAQFAGNAGNAQQLGGAPAADYATVASAQARVTGTCTGGQAITRINMDGTVTCDDVGQTVVQACPAGQAIAAIAPNGTAMCRAFGDVTNVIGGTGLTDSGDSGAITLNADTSFLQRRVEACGVGTAIRSVAADGSVTCQPGILIEQFIVNTFTRITTTDFTELRADYRPPQNARIFLYARCQQDANAANQGFSYRVAVRVGTSVSLGNNFYLDGYTPGANIPVQQEQFDFFDVAAGVATDLGVDASDFPATTGTRTDYCTMMVQVFSR
jgi:hypothetical protein